MKKTIISEEFEHCQMIYLSIMAQRAGNVSESKKHGISGKEWPKAYVNPSDSCITNPTATAHEWELSLLQGQAKI